MSVILSYKLPILNLMILMIVIILVSNCKKNPIAPEKIIEPPKSVYVKILQNSNLESFAKITWDKSPQHDDSDFKGYLVITFIVNRDGLPEQIFDSTFVTKNVSRNLVLQNIRKSVRYRTEVYSVDIKNNKSKPTKSIIYAGIFYGEGFIEEFKPDSSTFAGFGWEPFSGNGNSYKFIYTNLSNIDLHLRNQNNVLTFFTPDYFAKTINARKTRFYVLTKTGQDAFEDIESLEEPTLSGVAVVKDYVYLIKTQDSIYIKLWVKNIRTIGSGINAIQKVEFDFRLQPIINLRVVKY